jgi:hypothetical protein
MPAVLEARVTELRHAAPPPRHRATERAGDADGVAGSCPAAQHRGRAGRLAEGGDGDVQNGAVVGHSGLINVPTADMNQWMPERALTLPLPRRAVAGSASASLLAGASLPPPNRFAEHGREKLRASCVRAIRRARRPPPGSRRRRCASSTRAPTPRSSSGGWNALPRTWPIQTIRSRSARLAELSGAGCTRSPRGIKQGSPRDRPRRQAT